MTRKLRTNVSRPYWCRPSSNSYEFEGASLHNNDHEGLGWMDQLLNGGIVLPGGDRAVTVLLTGPPGTGKSTLAMELACRWTESSAWPTDATKEGLQPRILYVTTEAPANWFIANAKTYQWNFALQSIKASSGGQQLQPGRVNVMHLEPFELFDAVKPESIASKIFGIFRPHTDHDVR